MSRLEGQEPTKHASAEPPPMRFVYSHQGKKGICNLGAGRLLIGRAQDGVAVDIDLDADKKVSRNHARIWIEGGCAWIEDTGSTRGTLLNGREIKNRGKQQMQPGDTIRVGETTLCLETADETETDGAGFATIALDATQSAFFSARTESDRRLEFFYKLPLIFGGETRLDSLLQTIVEQLVAAIPNAARGALLAKDRSASHLLLKAHRPAGNPAVSTTLAERAIERREAFIWSERAPGFQENPQTGDSRSQSVVQHGIASAMYAPLLWKEEVLGVLCVDNLSPSPPFVADDLRLLQAVAHHAAMAIAQQNAREDLQRHAEFTERMFSRRFPPGVRKNITRQACAGLLSIGARSMPVTVLDADIRGFTRLTEQLGALRTNDLINEYFPQLMAAIFSQGGTIERFVGDAIFAVFGSPEPDENQHEHAVRAAIGLQEAMTASDERRNARGVVTCEIGIGIDCGDAFAGFIGNSEWMDFAVVGPAANRASRYCAAAGAGELLISPEVHQHVWKIVEAEPRTIVTKNDREFSAYRVLRLK